MKLISFFMKEAEAESESYFYFHQIVNLTWFNGQQLLQFQFLGRRLNAATLLTCVNRSPEGE